MQVKQLAKHIHSIARNIGKRGRICDGSTLHNQDCDDPLLDLQLRSFFRSEYAGKEPPRDAYIRLVRTLRLNTENGNQRQRAWSRLKGTLARISAQFSYLLAALYKAGSRADTSRLVSGTLVATLLVLAMAPNMLHPKLQSGASSSTSSLQGSSIEEIRRQSSGATSEGLTPGGTSQELSVLGGQPNSADRASEQQRLLLEQKIGESLSAPAQPEGSDYLHPVELGIAPERPSRFYSHPDNPRMPLWEQ